MRKKGLSKKRKTATSVPQISLTIREASTGKKHTSVKSSLKLQHIKNLAVWASRDAAIPSLAAFFGHHMAASSEALVAPVDPSLSTCERCESILHLGCNCTIRVQKTKTNAQHKAKKTAHPRNTIVYTCHFCSHQNMKRGTPKNTSQPKVKPHPKSTIHSTTSNRRNTICSSNMTKDNTVANAILASPMPTTGEEPRRGKMGHMETNETSTITDDSTDLTTADIGETGVLDITDTLELKKGYDASGPATPLTRSTLTLLDLRKNRAGAKKKVEPESNPNVKSWNRRRRRSWTSLKEMAESNENYKRRKMLKLT